MDAHEAGGLWLLREMWGFPAGVPEDERVEYLKTIMACARCYGESAARKKDWVIGYGAACGAHQSTVDELEAYEPGEDALEILERNMPSAQTWRRVAVFDAIRAAVATGDYTDQDKSYIRRIAARLDVDEQVIAALEQLHEEEQSLKQRRIALVFGNEVPYQDRDAPT
jgi:hypothetical protein